MIELEIIMINEISQSQRNDTHIKILLLGQETAMKVIIMKDQNSTKGLK